MRILLLAAAFLASCSSPNIQPCGSDLECCTLHNDCDKPLYGFVACSEQDEFDCIEID